MFYAMPESCQKSMIEQGFNYLYDAVSVQNMKDFFESSFENLEAKPEVNKAKKATRIPLRNVKVCSVRKLLRKILLKPNSLTVRGPTVLTTYTVVTPQIYTLYSRNSSSRGRRNTPSPKRSLKGSKRLAPDNR